MAATGAVPMFPVRPSVWLEVQRLESGESGVSASSMYIVILSYRRRRKVTPLYVCTTDFQSSGTPQQEIASPEKDGTREISSRAAPKSVVLVWNHARCRVTEL